MQEKLLEVKKMKAKYKIETSERKKLAQTIGEWLNSDVKYLWAPTFAYKIGGFEIDCNGNLTFESESNSLTIQAFIDHLNSQGYNCIADEAQKSTDSGPETQAEKNTQKWYAGTWKCHTERKYGAYCGNAKGVFYRRSITKSSKSDRC